MERTILAGVSVAITILKRNMVVIIAIITYLRICREIYWNYGKFDWKLWTIAGSMTAILSFMGTRGYGANKYCTKINTRETANNNNIETEDSIVSSELKLENISPDTNSQWKEPYCRTFAGVSIATTILKRNIIVIIAIVTYLRVCREVYWNYGKFDWKLWTIAGFMTAILSFMGARGYGTNKYCTKASTMSVSLISLSLSLVVVS
ncbi:7507_t:CDS:2, partial [Diversispora eburnea]